MEVWGRTYFEIGRPLIVAHRGDLTAGIENSKTAVLAAVAAGADAVEVDIRLTADFVPVCVHDDCLEVDSGGGRICVSQVKCDELRRACPDVLTMEEALREVAPRGLLLDVKETHLERVKRIVECIQVCDSNRCLFGIRSVRISQYVNRLSSTLSQICLMRDGAELQWYINKRPGSWVRLSAPTASKNEVLNLKKLGAKVLIVAGGMTHETVGRATRQDLRQLLALQPDAVMMTDPNMAFTEIDGDAYSLVQETEENR